MNEKELLERRQDLHDEMETILNNAKAENRVMNETEVARFDELEKSIKDIDATLEREEKLNKMEKKEIKVEDKIELTQEQKEKLADLWNRNFNAVYNPDYKKMPMIVKGLSTVFLILDNISALFCFLYASLALSSYMPAG